MTNDDLNKNLDAIMVDAAAEMLCVGMRDLNAAYRGMAVKALHHLMSNLPDDQLADNLSRFRHWMDVELQNVEARKH